jgi:Mn-dependent DtxR family transcriptional regulator
MDKLTRQLRSQLLENPAIQIKSSLLWQLPVITYEVTFKRVKRSIMDILMKMMLLTFEQTDIRRAANLSELLLVEELFIADLLTKMQRMGLVRLEKDSYKLTDKGHEQLKTGIIVEELEEESTELSYSPIHDEFWSVMSESLQETNEELPSFRYTNNQDNINTERILQILTEKEPTIEETDFQTVIAEVTSFTELKVDHIPFLEFQLYDKEQDIFYARVWNTWLRRWDETLEKQIEEKEQLEWREQWMAVEKVSE